MLGPYISQFGRVTSDVIIGMGVTQFLDFGESIEFCLICANNGRVFRGGVIGEDQRPANISKWLHFPRRHVRAVSIWAKLSHLGEFAPKRAQRHRYRDRRGPKGR